MAPGMPLSCWKGVSRQSAGSARREEPFGRCEEGEREGRTAEADRVGARDTARRDDDAEQDQANERDDLDEREPAREGRGQARAREKKPSREEEVDAPELGLAERADADEIERRNDNEEDCTRSVSVAEETSCSRTTTTHQ